jgi:hypothetical protein
VKLPKRIVFQPEEYEVGLAEISYVKSNKFKLPSNSKVYGPPSLDPNTTKEVGWVTLPEHTKYSSNGQVAEEINKLLLQENASLIWNQHKQRFEVILRVSPIVFSKNLARKLGFTSDTLEENGNVFFRSRMTYTADSPPSMGDDVYQVYVYSDIVQPQIVGDSLVPLLRIVNLSGAKNEIVNQQFRPYYKPVAKLDFDTIEILLYNEFGEEFEFTRGECVVTLHFRRKSK